MISTCKKEQSQVTRNLTTSRYTSKGPTPQDDDLSALIYPTVCIESAWAFCSYILM